MARSFPSTSFYDRDTGRRGHGNFIHCAWCLNVAHLDKAYPDPVAAKFFRSRGWVVGNKPTGDRCPACFGKIRNAAKTKAVTGEPTMAADAPRQCTAADNRRICEALDERYEMVRACYKGDWTDAKMGDDLKVPRAWVSQMRNMLYGPEANEAQAAENARWLELEGRCKALEKKGLDLATEAEKLARDIAGRPRI